MSLKRLFTYCLGTAVCWLFAIEQLYAAASQAEGATAAVSAPSVSLGVISDNITSPIAFVGSIAEKASFVMGVVFILGSFMRYKEHRNNPTQITWGQIITLFLLGLFFVLLPLLAGLSPSSEPIKNI